ncbi:endo-1,4-beta-xylanase [Polymorphobacter fuscus]|uniref:Beta-xylanase n=1 Tax=Sandarakinorhabdus fusca TaxID=1439888 RepID=A0A7C9KJP8_9SPHN|nr:endo-1,4-beta-xylanase [Polymorphobacter fuscus]KAB7644097.1 endo-1,4-beta-xylanase [Polymorphobacter fuscus]MQT18480.1 glycosyl hydrolase [Polymorphobacter fuscus]NJC08399.1 endo-1,4-beta-xylanase [Polymorphobacter fuscus]
MIDRRGVLKGAAAAAALPLLGAATAADSLAAVAASKGLRFGSTVGGKNFEDPAYRALNVAQCGLIVPENAMKWVALRPDAKSFDFRAADAIVRWAVDNRMGVRGHTLLWHSPQWMPDWVTRHDYGAQPAREAARLLADHVGTVAARYAGVIDSFDVVNEAVDSDTGGLRETALSKAMGAENAIDLAFRTARQAAPGAQLVYNDYMSWQDDGGKHRDGVLRLLEALKKRGTPVDALGVQGHLGSKYSDTPTGLGSLDVRAWRRFLDDATGMGLDLLVTELDVHDNPLPADFAVRDKLVADHTRAYLDLMLSYPQLKTIMCWGLSDKYSWLQGLRPRPDGLPKRPLPFDADFAPKPMRDAIAAAIKAAAPR